MWEAEIINFGCCCCSRALWRDFILMSLMLRHAKIIFDEQLEFFALNFPMMPAYRRWCTSWWPRNTSLVPWNWNIYLFIISWNFKRRWKGGLQSLWSGEIILKVWSRNSKWERTRENPFSVYLAPHKMAVGKNKRISKGKKGGKKKASGMLAAAQ